jgi:hypothetical protein
MYESGTLRPPTAADLAAKRLPLERIEIEHRLCQYRQTCNLEQHVDNYTVFTVSDLIALCQEYGIPYESDVVSDGSEGGLALDWSRLAECPGCGLWVHHGRERTHEDTDAHKAIVFARAHPPVVELTLEQMRILGRTPAV